MAYNALNNLIDAYIYANGVQAITGQILNGVLKQMVSQLGSGYHLMGVAIPATVPASDDYAMAYFAATEGEYTDFGGITLAAGEVAVLLTSGNGSWSKQTIYTVPTTTEDLENTAGFITNAVTDLVNYYTKTEVDTTLADYPTLQSLATALADYYTKQEVDETLDDYATKDGVDETLEDYYTKDEMDAALGDRYTKSETDTKLADYYKKTETYDKDEVDSIVAALSRQEYIVAWDGLAAPDVSAIPAGVTVTYSGTTYTGTLAASASTVNKIYMVWNGTAYDMYGTSQDGGYSWVPMGTTSVDLSQYATKAELSQLQQEAIKDKKAGGVIKIYTEVQNIAMDDNAKRFYYTSSASFRAYYIPVSKGDVVRVTATHPSAESFKCCFSQNIPANMVVVQELKVLNAASVDETLVAPVSGYFSVLKWYSLFTDMTFYKLEDKLTLIEKEIADVEKEVGTKIKNGIVEAPDLDITDEDGNVLARFQGGNIQTKNFDSSVIPGIISDNLSLDGRMGAAENKIQDLENGGFEMNEEFVAGQIKDYLDTHPEMMTTVVDGSITTQKLASNLKNKMGMFVSSQAELEAAILAGARIVYLVGTVNITTPIVSSSMGTLNDIVIVGGTVNLSSDMFSPSVGVAYYHLPKFIGTKFTGNGHNICAPAGYILYGRFEQCMFADCGLISTAKFVQTVSFADCRIAMEASHPFISLDAGTDITFVRCGWEADNKSRCVESTATSDSQYNGMSLSFRDCVAESQTTEFIYTTGGRFLFDNMYTEANKELIKTGAPPIGNPSIDIRLVSSIIESYNSQYALNIGNDYTGNIVAEFCELYGSTFINRIDFTTFRTEFIKMVNSQVHE